MIRLTVPWENQSNIWWSDTCARIIEHFGLPGDRFVTEVSAECMHFDFKNEQDALMCRLLISDSIS
jgi:hypothetical protein